jgi:hypothetical protein
MTLGWMGREAAIHHGPLAVTVFGERVKLEVLDMVLENRALGMGLGHKGIVHLVLLVVPPLKMV